MPPEPAAGASIASDAQPGPGWLARACASQRNQHTRLDNALSASRHEQNTIAEPLRDLRRLAVRCFCRSAESQYQGFSCAFPPLARACQAPAYHVRPHEFSGDMPDLHSRKSPHEFSGRVPDLHMTDLKDEAQARTCLAHLSLVLHFFSNRIMKLVLVKRLVWLPESRQRSPQQLSL